MRKYADVRDLLGRHGFLGHKVVLLLISSPLAALALFVVELALAYGLQAFLLLLGIAESTALKLPAAVPQGDLKAVLLFIFFVALARGALVWAQNYMRGATSEEFKYNIRTRMLRWTFYGESASASRVTSLFGERANQAAICVKYIQMGLMQFTMSVFLAAYMFYISPAITLAAGGILALFILPMRAMNKKIREAGWGLSAEWDKTHARLVLGIRNLLLLRAYGLEPLEEKETQKNLKRYLGHYLTFAKASGALSIVPQAIGVTLICMLIFFAKARFQLPPGELLSYFYLFIRLLQNMSLLGQATSNTLFQWAQLKLIYDWWSSEGTKTPRFAAAQTPEQRPFSTAIGWNISKIRFRYSPQDAEVLQDLSLTIAPKSATVIMGPSGVGKSTLLNVLLGELRPDSGKIDVVIPKNGSDAQVEPLESAKAKLLPVVGYVGPESFIIEGSIKDNLLYGLQTRPSQGQLDDALRKAECGFIAELPHGLDHILTDQGQGLSAGQKQRLSLARALLRQPKVLVLDEATANLDVATEAKLVQTLMNLKGQMTMVIVTHRQGLIALADHVVTMGAP